MIKKVTDLLIAPASAPSDSPGGDPHQALGGKRQSGWCRGTTRAPGKANAVSLIDGSGRSTKTRQRAHRAICRQSDHPAAGASAIQLSPMQAQTPTEGVAEAGVPSAGIGSKLRPNAGLPS